MNAMLDLAAHGIGQLVIKQQEALNV